MGKRSQSRYQLPAGSARLRAAKGKVKADGGLHASRKNKVKTRELACGGKRRFRDKQEAERSMHGIQNGHGKPGGDASVCRAYECPRCQGWHLTSRASA